MIFKITKEALEDSDISLDEFLDSFRKAYRAGVVITDQVSGDKVVQVYKAGGQRLEPCLDGLFKP